MSYQMAQKYLQKHQLQQEHKQMLQRATQMALQQDRQRVRRRRMARPQPGAPVIKRPRGGESQESGEDHGDQGKDEGKKPELAHVGHSLCLYTGRRPNLAKYQISPMHAFLW